MTAGIAELVAAAASDPDRSYLEDARTDRTITYGALAVAVRGGMRFFADRPDATRVGIDVADPLDFARTHLAVLATGRFSAPLDPQAPAADRERAVRNLGCDLLVSDRPERWHGTPAAVLPDAVMAPGGPDEDPASAAPPPGGGTGGVLMQTSGSTGRPKIVRLREDQLLTVARDVAANLQLRPQDRGYNPLPLFHINGQVVAVLATLVARSTLVLDQRFHRTGFWPLIERRRITWVNAVPAILSILATELPQQPPPDLRLIRSASAPLPPRTRARIEHALRVPLVESYGMTEAASQIAAGAADGSTPAGSVGRPVSAELAVRGAGPDGVGRIWIRGPGVVTSYDDGRSAERFDADGWLDTGDDGRLGETGELYIAGRSDDQINRGGELIYPSEVEDVLRGDDRVAEVAVVGRTDETMGQVPVAFVILREPDSFDGALVADLEERARAELSPFKRPVEIRVVADLPRAPTGKIRRSLVLAAADQAAAVGGAS